ncbi:MAG TPA: hypothetical protein VGA13_01850 [Acidimicrobiales bacterium]
MNPTLRYGLRLSAIVAVLFILTFDVGVPIFTAINLDDDTHAAADDAQRFLDRSRDLSAARDRVERAAEAIGADLVMFEVDREGRIRMALTKRVNAYVLDSIGPLADRYLLRSEVRAVRAGD